MSSQGRRFRCIGVGLAGFELNQSRRCAINRQRQDGPDRQEISQCNMTIEAACLAGNQATQRLGSSEGAVVDVHQARYERWRAEQPKT
jgi:hypothetical protein